MLAFKKAFLKTDDARLRLKAVIIGLVSTLLLFAAGFYDGGFVKPEKSDEGFGRKAPVTVPLEEEIPDETIMESSAKPVPQQPKVSVRTETPVDAPIPDIKPDFAVNPMIDAGVAVPALPSVAAVTTTASAVFSVSELDNEPALLFSPNPFYPTEAKRRKKEGTVRVRLILDTDGRVVDAQAMPGPDNETFAQTTLQAVKRWRFKPAERNGRRVMCRVEIPIQFKLQR